MKKIIKTLILVFILIFSLTSCGKIEETPITPGTQIGGNNQNPDDNQNSDDNQNPNDNQNEALTRGRLMGTRASSLPLRPSAIITWQPVCSGEKPLR